MQQLETRVPLSQVPVQREEQHSSFFLGYSTCTQKHKESDFPVSSLNHFNALVTVACIHRSSALLHKVHGNHRLPMNTPCPTVLENPSALCMAKQMDPLLPSISPELKYPHFINYWIFFRLFKEGRKNHIAFQMLFC